MTKKSLETISVHAGEDSAKYSGAISVPIYNASVFAFDDPDEAAAIHNHEKPGYFYGRLGNPTTDALERADRDHVDPGDGTVGQPTLEVEGQRLHLGQLGHRASLDCPAGRAE